MRIASKLAQKYSRKIEVSYSHMFQPPTQRFWNAGANRNQ